MTTGLDLQALAKDRWDTVTTGIDPANAAPELSSAVMERWMDATRQILGRTMHGATGDAEYTLLTRAEDRLLGILGDMAIELTVAVETLRANERESFAPFLAQHSTDAADKPQLTPA